MAPLQCVFVRALDLFRDVLEDLRGLHKHKKPNEQSLHDMSIVKRLAASHILLVDRFGRLGLEVPVLRLKTWGITSHLQKQMCYRTTTDASSRALKYAPEFSEKKSTQKLNINLKQTGLVMGATGRTFDRLLLWADFGAIA